MNFFEKQRDLPFSSKSDAKQQKSVVSFICMSIILFAAKHSWMTLSMSRPLFVGSYLQVTW